MAVNTHDLVRLRIIILCLGESHHANWWRTQFLSPTGLSFLERLYPRSTFTNCVRSAAQAARVVHDEAIGLGQIFHLFRLPRHLENQVGVILRHSQDGFQQEFQSKFTDESALLGMLFAQVEESNAYAQGPVRLNFVENLWIGQMAALYYHAFVQHQQVFPYFEARAA